MEIDELKAREFWSKPPIERSQIAAERLKHCMADFQVTAEQVAGYTRMDLPRLQAILGGEVVMGIDEFMDIYHSIPDANESRIAADNLYHHHMIGALKKILLFLHLYFAMLEEVGRGGHRERLALLALYESYKASAV